MHFTRRLPVVGSLAAGVLSVMGNTVALIVLPWLVLTLTGSPLWTGVAAASGIAPLIVGSLIGGGIIDRIGPRWVAVTGELVSAATVAAVAVLHQTGALSIGTLIALIALGSLFDGPATIAGKSRHPELARLARIRLERIKAIDELGENAARLIGPALAGAMIATAGIEYTLWLTAACSLGAAMFDALSLPTNRKSSASAETTTGIAGSMDGARFLFRDPLLRALVGLGTLFAVVFGALEVVIMPAFFKSSGQGALSLGLFLSAAGAGAAIGTLVYAAWGHRLDARMLFLCGCAVESIAIFTIGFAPPVPVLIAAGALAGFAVGPLGPIVATATLRRVPSRLRGRVLGAAGAIELSAVPVAVIAAGAAFEFIGAQWLLFGSAVALGLLTLFAASLSALRQLDARSDHGAVSAGFDASSDRAREPARSAKLPSVHELP